MPKNKIDPNIGEPNIWAEDNKGIALPTFSEVLTKLGVPPEGKTRFYGEGRPILPKDKQAEVDQKMMETKLGTVPWKFPLDKYDPEIRKGIIETNDNAIKDIIDDPRLAMGLGDVHHKLLKDTIFKLHPQIRAELYPFINEYIVRGSGKTTYDSLMDKMDSYKNAKNRI